MAEPTTVERQTDGRQAARRYPPLLTLLVALALALFVLPSSLNLPQANPATTVELAPVPPTDDKTPPPPTGNLSQLGLAGSSTLAGDTTGGNGGDGSGLGGLPPAPDLTGKGKSPQTKHCVGKPPRQTEDPLSPPCVANFEGDNGGATYQGVTKDEIKILFYYDAGIFTNTARGTETTPSSTMVDMDAPPQQGEVGVITMTRGWQKYFNDRYQTYGRRAHFFIYFGNSAAATAQTRQSDAAQSYTQLHPFAVISYASLSGFADVYTNFMAQHGVLTFGSVQGRSETFFNQYPKLSWGYPPSIEESAKGYVNFVCNKVVPYKTSFGGNGVANGQDRKYGMITTSDAAYPGVRQYYDQVKAGVKACGANIVDEVTYPTNGYTIDNGNTPQYALQNMQSFQSKGVTTILWPQGTEIKQSQAAGQLRYYPEWVIGGDSLQDGTTYGQRQDQTEWAHAWLYSNQVYTPVLEQQLCYQAYREVDQSAASLDVNQFACPEYNDLRQLFTGIQVAGPRLGPSSIDKGYHAIPSIASTDARVPSCFYEPGDYTCVKDSVAEWWDVSGIAPNNGDPGCWRMAGQGKRYIFGQEPKTELTTTKTATDQCNGYEIVEYLNPYPPGTN